ncbi:hypothetical protein [Methylobacillus sp.]|uniref:hypothetical protein n=1 Tax=Methylobacillus sp. TaxID=56818 RepID=UPI0012C876A0|nr:hypothetical protein [Methylobacillus sp.]MPS48108.1 hypothetical protein [Methylobacillus sp.]
MNLNSLLTIVMTGTLLNACAHQPTPAQAPVHQAPHTPQPTKERNAASNLLEFISHFSELSLESQKKELAEALKKISSNNKDLHQKTRVAIIYAIPGSKLRDPIKAQPLLEELAREKQLGKEENAIVSILRENAAEIAKLNQRLRDEIRRADESQQKADNLQQKLDELKKIERTMMQKSLKNPPSRSNGK